MERMEWAIRAVLLNPEVGEGDLQYFADWEPFALFDDFVMVKKEVMIEDEKSSTSHEMSFAERYER